MYLTEMQTIYSTTLVAFAPSPLHNLLAHRQTASFPMIGKKFPMVGKISPFFPMIGKTFRQFSNDWKKFSREGRGRDVGIENHENRFADMEKREGRGWDVKLDKGRTSEVRGEWKAGGEMVFPFRVRCFGIGSRQDCGRMGAQVARHWAATTENQETKITEQKIF